MHQIEERVIALLHRQFKVKEESLALDVTLGKLSFDSLVLVELALALDTEFGVELAEGELTEHLTVREVAELLDAKGVAAR